MFNWTHCGRISPPNATIPVQNCCSSSLESEIIKKCYIFQNVFDSFLRKVFCALTSVLLLFLFVSMLTFLYTQEWLATHFGTPLENEVRMHIATFKHLTIFNALSKDRFSTSIYFTFIESFANWFFRAQIRPVSIIFILVHFESAVDLLKNYFITILIYSYLWCIQAQQQQKKNKLRENSKKRKNLTEIHSLNPCGFSFA